MRIHDVLKRPIITEKAFSKGQNQEYAFDVNVRANKHKIKEAIETLLNVEVKHVKTLVKKGKMKRVGKRMRPKKLPDVKRAYITLKKGTIDLVPKA